MQTQNRKIVVVLGSGRSGTSLLMNIANTLGVQVSPELIESNSTNIQGTWEDREILEISRGILRFFHRNSRNLSFLPMPSKWIEHEFVKEEITKLVKIISSRVENTIGIWGFKEPVTAKLLPLWNEVFSQLQIEPIYLLSLRHPQNVIRSFVKAYGTNPVVAEHVWLSRYLDAIVHTRGSFFVFVYDLWFTDPAVQGRALIEVLGRDSEMEDHHLLSKLQTTINKKLFTAKDNLPELSNQYTEHLYKLLLKFPGTSEAAEQLVEEARTICAALDDYPLVRNAVDFITVQLDRKTERLEEVLAKLRSRNIIKIPLNEIRNKLPEITCHKIVAGVASFPEREKIFQSTVESILPQVDHLYVYLNKYEYIPDFLNSGKITVFLSQEFEDLSANGKVFFLDKLKSCYFFSIDDDILYPSNYISQMINCLEKYENKVAVSVHGSIFPSKVDWYFERYSLYPFQRKLETDKFVTLIGSGTFAFHTDILQSNFSDFYPDVMVDLNFSILARNQGIPLVCIARPEMWLKALATGDGLYQKYYEKKTIHTTMAVRNNPWSFDVIASYVMPVIEAVFPNVPLDELDSLQVDTDFINAYRKGDIPDNWRESDLYRRKVEEKKVLSKPLKSYWKVKKDVTRQQLKVKKLTRENRELKNSTSYRLGHTIVKATKKPGIRTLFLPIDLLKIIVRSMK